MGTILDKINDENDERLRQLDQQRKQKICPDCGKVHEGDTEVCFECKYVNNNI